MEHIGKKLAFALASAFLAGNVWAAEWDFSESLLTSIAHTDNVGLDESDPESRWALIVSPNFLLNGKGRRMTVSIAAALQFVSDSDQTFYPQISANAHTELVKNKFFLDAFASAHQQTINPLRPAGTAINDTGNLTTTYTVGFNPYYIEQFDDIAELRLDYGYRHAFYVADEVDNRDYNDFYFRLNSGRAFTALDWGLFGRYEKTTYDGGGNTDATFKSLDFRLGYRLTRSLAPYFSIGREWNSFSSSSRTGGEKWVVGAVWRPNSRIDLDAGYGYRFFGHYPFVNLSYRHKHSALRLSYREDLQSGYIPLDQQGVLAQQDLLGNPVDPFTGDPLDQTDVQSADLINNGANVAKRFQAAYQLSGRRSSLSLNGWFSDRVYLDSSQELQEWRAWLRLNRRLARQLTVSGNMAWYRTEDETDFRSDTWNLGFLVTRGLGPYTNLSFSYTYSNRDSNRPDDSYTENRLALVLRTSLVKLAKHADLF